MPFRSCNLPLLISNMVPSDLWECSTRLFGALNGVTTSSRITPTWNTYMFVVLYSVSTCFWESKFVLSKTHQIQKYKPTIRMLIFQVPSLFKNKVQYKRWREDLCWNPLVIFNIISIRMTNKYRMCVCIYVCVNVCMCKCIQYRCINICIYINSHTEGHRLMNIRSYEWPQSFPFSLSSCNINKN